MAGLVRVSGKAYKRLFRLAGRLQHHFGRRLSLGDAIEYLLARCECETPEYWRRMRKKKKA